MLLVVLLDAAARTLEYLGLTRPARLPVGVGVFGALFLLIGLPNGWIDAPFSDRLVELGDWGALTALKAILFEALGFFTLALALAAFQAGSARQRLSGQVMQELMAHADALLAEPVSGDAELRDWLARQDVWLRGALDEIAESVSPQAADGLRRVSVDEPVHFRHRYNDVHDAALGLLARRLRYLRALRPTRPAA